MSEVPHWTVVVPTFDRPAPLRATLAAIDRLRPPPGGFEVLVVDDGGTADLGFVVAFDRVRLLRQDNAGPAAARNAGAAAARGSFLAFTDDDCRPRFDWLTRLAAACDATPDALVGGRTVNGLVGNRCSAASQMLVDAFTQWENRGDAPRFFASNNIALRRADFLPLGGFDTSFPLAAGEDRRFCEEWTRSGRRLVEAPDAVIEHCHDLTLARYWRQQANYGSGAFRLGVQAARAKPDRLAFTSRLLREPWRARSAGALTLTGLLALSQAATAWGYAREAAAARRARRNSTRTVR